MNLIKFVMANENTCSNCGTPIKVGDPVFATDQGKAASGNGICVKCFKGEKAEQAKQPEAQGVASAGTAPDPEATQGPEKTSKPRKQAGK